MCILQYLKLKTKKGDESTEAALTSEISDIPDVIKNKAKPYITFFTVKLRGLAYNAKKKDVKLFFQPLKPKSIRIPVKVKGIAYVCFKSEKEMKQALVKNKSFLGKKNMQCFFICFKGVEIIQVNVIFIKLHHHYYVIIHVTYED